MQWLTKDLSSRFAFTMVVLVNGSVIIGLVLRFAEIASELSLKNASLKAVFSCGAFIGAIFAAIYGLKCAVKHYCENNDWENRWILWYFIQIISGAVGSSLGMISLIAIRATPADAEGLNLTVSCEMMIAAAVSGYQGVKYIDKLIFQRDNSNPQQIDVKYQNPITVPFSQPDPQQPLDQMPPT